MDPSLQPRDGVIHGAAQLGSAWGHQRLPRTLLQCLSAKQVPVVGDSDLDRGEAQYE